MSQILVITTGGTIGALAYRDPKLPPKISAMPSNGRDIVQEFLDTQTLSIDTNCISLEPLDSTLMDDFYRDKILFVVQNASEKRILITHGTNTILNTAEYFYQKFEANLISPNKIIVLTGAMIPLANGSISDGQGNLTFSLKILQENFLNLAKINIVLCDQNQDSWQPRLYPYEPGRYEKFYDADARYNRIIDLSETQRSKQ